tara:strand:- start:4948 stop:5166 length:219 start_codon:yes stop_codon:yes gene_type:complete
MKKRRGPPKDKKTRIPKKYLSGTKGSKRAELARAIKRIAKLYKEGKTVPRSLIKKRVALGKRKKSGRKKKKR